MSLRGGSMKELKIEECNNIIGGGINFTGTIVNAIKSSVNIFFQIGQAVGGSLRRITSHNLCNF